MKAIILGGMAAGMSAASKLKRVRPDADVVIYEKGSFLSYGACGLPYFIGGFNTDPGKMIARTQEQYDQMGLRICLRHEALRVDVAAKRVQIRNNESCDVFWDDYDKLMISVGCESVMPKVQGSNLPTVFYMKTMEDGLLFQKVLHFQGADHVVIVGGGYIGVEMADVLRNLKKRVTVLEVADRLLTSFEPEFSELAAREMERQGVSVKLGERLAAITDEGDHRLVHTDHGDIRADVVLVAAGVMPATEFLNGTGLIMARNGALLVDRQQRTSNPDIFAAGDCAMCWHRVAREDCFLPLGTVANKCGRIAGANMAGGFETFEGMLGTAAIKVCDLEMMRTGLSEADAQRMRVDYGTKLVTALDHPPYYPNPTKLTIKLLYEKRTLRLLGANIAGVKGAVLRGNIFATAIHAGMTTMQLGTVDLAYAPPFATVWDSVHIAANTAK